MMKTILVLALFTAQTISYAQDADYKAYARKKNISEFGILAGPSLSFLRGSPSVETNEVYTRYLKTGYTIGVSAAHNFSQKLNLTAILVFESKGGVTRNTVTSFDPSSQTSKQGDSKSEYIFRNVTMPITLKYRLSQKANWQVGLGPFLSYLENQILNRDLSPTGFDWREEQSALNKNFELGLSISLSRDFRISGSRLINISLLNNLGLTDTRQVKGYGPVKTNNTNLLIGVTF